MKDTGRRTIFAVVSGLASVLPFLQAVDLFHWLVKMFSGLASFGALMALIPLAIVELAFVIMIGPYYKGARTPLQLTRRFLTVFGIELVVVFLLEAARFLTLRLSSGIPLVIYRGLRPPLYTAAAVVCLGVSVLLLGAAILLGRRPRSVGGV